MHNVSSFLKIWKWAMLGLAMAAPAGATTFLPRPFPETVKDAPIIVRGVVGGSYTDWSSGGVGGRRIYTLIELRIEEILKGDVSGPNLVMRELGGEKDGVGMQVAGTAQFNRGEDVVVFLGERNPDGSYDVRGMMMGKYNIEKDDRGNEVIVGPGLNPSAAAHASHESMTGDHGHSATTERWTIDALKKLIREQKEVAAGRDSRAPEENRQVTARLGEPVPPPTSLPLASGTTAPQLQNQETDKGDSGTLFRALALTVIAVSVIFLFRALRR